MNFTTIPPLLNRLLAIAADCGSLLSLFIAAIIASSGLIDSWNASALPLEMLCTAAASASVGVLPLVLSLPLPVLPEEEHAVSESPATAPTAIVIVSARTGRFACMDVVVGIAGNPPLCGALTFSITLSTLLAGPDRPDATLGGICESTYRRPDLVRLLRRE